MAFNQNFQIYPRHHHQMKQLVDGRNLLVISLILLNAIPLAHNQAVSEIQLVSDPSRSAAISTSSSSSHEDKNDGARPDGIRRGRTDGLYDAGDAPEFNPTVTAKCERGVMNIAVATSEPFWGVIHARDFRRPRCMSYGNGTHSAALFLSLLATNVNDEGGYCGISKSRGSEERSLAIAVRSHRTLELSDDKFYVISCAHSGFRNARNAFSHVSLRLLDLETGDRRIRAVQGRSYGLRAELSAADGVYGIQVRNCFAFSSPRAVSSRVAKSQALSATTGSAITHEDIVLDPGVAQYDLIGREGCPSSPLMSPFEYNSSFASSWGEGVILDMFKFPYTTKVHIQCDVVLCRGGSCPTPNCDGGRLLKGAALDSREAAYEGAMQLLASTTVYVVDEGEETQAIANLQECTEWRFPWLITLCIILAILLLVMLLMNIFLCSSLSCSCVKTEVLEREASEVDEYDPYNKMDPWLVGAPTPVSQYGSRASLNRADGPPTIGYLDGMDSDEGRQIPITTTRSMSRPGSRAYSAYSAGGTRMPEAAPAHLYAYR